MCDYEYGCFAEALPQLLLNEVVCLHIDACGRFIEHEDARLAQNCPGEAQKLFLPS